MSLVKSKWMVLLAFLGVEQAFAQFVVTDKAAVSSMTPIDLVREADIKKLMIEKSDERAKVNFFCDTLHPHFIKHFKEGNPCGKVPWNASFQTKNGHPLLYASFGDEGPVTLIISGVHPDEFTPLPMGFRLAKYLMENPAVYEKKFKIIVAPLANPDGFIRNVPTRTNANGIDPNRNFLTLDWYENSKKFWQGKQRRFRHFPGYFPNTEIETFFQIQLVEQFRPDKILSVHAPLGFLDYDGPQEVGRKDHTFVSKHGKQLLQQVSEKARNYRIVDYSFYPGSLGNFAGNERNIITVTLELETTNPLKVDEYWKQFLPGLIVAASYEVKAPVLQGGGNASNFLTLYLGSGNSSRLN